MKETKYLVEESRFIIIVSDSGQQLGLVNKHFTSPYSEYVNYIFLE